MSCLLCLYMPFPSSKLLRLCLDWWDEMEWNGIKLCSIVWIVKNIWNGMKPNGIYSILIHHLHLFLFPSNLGGIEWNHYSSLLCTYKITRFPFLFLFCNVFCCTAFSSLVVCVRLPLYPIPFFSPPTNICFHPVFFYFVLMKSSQIK